MQVLDAGPNKYLILELDPEFVGNIARQAGFEFKIDNQLRVLSIELAVTDRQSPLLLFDAADPGNLSWFPVVSSTWMAPPERFCRRRCPLQPARQSRTGSSACRATPNCKRIAGIVPDAWTAASE